MTKQKLIFQKWIMTKRKTDGNYDVIIDDEDGETRCRFGLNTSGAKQQYALPNLQEGVYTVTISSGINEFSGELYVDDDF